MRSDLQDRINRARAERRAESPQKRGKITRILIIGNILLLTIMLFYTRKPIQIRFFTSIIEYNQIHYRLSIAKNSDAQKIILSLVVKSKSPAKSSETYGKNIISISIKYNDILLHNAFLGNDINTLTFGPDEVKNYYVQVDESLFRKFAVDHPDTIIPQRKSYLFRDPQYIPFKVQITINTLKTIYSEIDFNYEID